MGTREPHRRRAAHPAPPASLVRIALVTEVWEPTINGVVTRLGATVDELSRAGHDVLVVAPDVGPPPRELPRVTVRTVPTVSIAFVYGGQPWGLPHPKVLGYLDEFGPDVVHAVNPTSLGLAGVLAAHRRRLPLVCSYHTDVATYMAYYHLGWLRPALHRVLRAVHGSAAVNLVTSDAAAAQLSHLRIPHVRRWAQGVDVARFRPRRGGCAPREGSRTALYVGRLAQEKNLTALAELTSVPDLRLVLVGDGPYRAALARTLRGPNVEFRGALSGDALADAYREADVFVFPSTTETLGLVLLEALASGLPVVAAESPASAEVLGGCRATRLWDPDRPGSLTVALDELLGSAGPDQLTATARRHVEHLTWEKATSELTGFYSAAIATSGGSRSSAG